MLVVIRIRILAPTRSRQHQAFVRMTHRLEEQSLPPFTSQAHGRPEEPAECKKHMKSVIDSMYRVPAHSRIAFCVRGDWHDEEMFLRDAKHETTIRTHAHVPNDVVNCVYAFCLCMIVSMFF
jgi:hypothetical protein